MAFGWRYANTSSVAALAKSLRSIKFRVTLSVVAALTTSVALTALLLVREAERNTLSNQRDRELREGVRTAVVLSHRVIDLQRALAVTAAMLDPATFSDDASMAAFVESKPVLRGLFANVFVATVDGRVRLMAEPSGLRRPALNLGDRGYFRKTVAERRSIVSEPLPGRHSAETVIIFTQPLSGPAGVYGVIGGALRLESRNLLDDLVDGQESTTEAMVVVTDATGKVLAHPDHSRIMSSLAVEPKMSEGYVDWMSQGGASGGAIEPSGLFLRQTGQVLTVAGVAGPDWLVWRAVPESALLAPLHIARRQALTWAGLIVAGVSLLMLGLVTWLLHPLSRLKHRALHLFNATHDIHAGWPEPDNEIGELSRVLRHVAAERAQLESFNAQVLAKLGSVMSAAPVGIMFTRAQQFELVSAEVCRLLGRGEETLMGQPTRTVFASNADYEALGPAVAAAFAAQRPYQGELKFLRADGSTFWGQLRGQSVEAGNPDAGTIWTLSDINQQVAAREELEWSANHDALTGLANRKLFESRMGTCLRSLPGSLPAAVVMIDLDQFKPVNDLAGHAAGDAMLKAVAKAITATVRSTDLAARLGGDEFALLLEHCPQEVAVRVAHNVRAAIAGVVLEWGHRRLRVGASIGLAALSTTTDDTAAWLHEADAACYAAKAAGRGVVRTAGGSALRVVASGPSAG